MAKNNFIKQLTELKKSFWSTQKKNLQRLIKIPLRLTSVSTILQCELSVMMNMVIVLYSRKKLKWIALTTPTKHRYTET